ncbi:MAG: T9SS type A sorting domain-containing protein [Bacteroidetes bacterium]|nr:T9SS type A sorting domain-containing protein [Bacteroidota bacterium]
MNTPVANILNLTGKIRLYICVISSCFFLLIPSFAYEQCDSIAGPYDAGTGATQTLSGGAYTFSSTSNVTSSDNQFASVTATVVLLSGVTNYITATNFNFNAAGINPASTVCGIEVDVQKKGSVLTVLGVPTAFITDNVVSIIKNNTIITAANRAQSGNWATSDTWYSYGSTTDAWGTTWTLADVLSSDFGVAISARLTSIATLLPTASIDNIRIKIYYDNGSSLLPLQLTSFDVQANENRSAVVRWSSATTSRNALFIVERSADGISWVAVDSIAANEKALTNGYQYTDKAPLQGESYYRLRIVSNGAKELISEIKAIYISGIVSHRLYPNPASEYIIVSNAGASSIVRVADISGRMCNVSSQAAADGSIKINLNNLVNGTYFVSVNHVVYSFIQN